MCRELHDTFVDNHWLVRLIVLQINVWFFHSTRLSSGTNLKCSTLHPGHTSSLEENLSFLGSLTNFKCAPFVSFLDSENVCGYILRSALHFLNCHMWDHSLFNTININYLRISLKYFY